MWDEEDGFYYDVLRLPDGQAQRSRSVDGGTAALVCHHGDRAMAAELVRCSPRFSATRQMPEVAEIHPP